VRRIVDHRVSTAVDRRVASPKHGLEGTNDNNNLQRTADLPGGAGAPVAAKTAPMCIADDNRRKVQEISGLDKFTRGRREASQPV